MKEKMPSPETSLGIWAPTLSGGSERGPSGRLLESDKAALKVCVFHHRPSPLPLSKAVHELTTYSTENKPKRDAFNHRRAGAMVGRVHRGHRGESRSNSSPL